MELLLFRPAYYRVRHGQSLACIARAFGVTPRLLAAFNRLEGEPEQGQVLALPPPGNLYTVRGGETRALLCGSPARFTERNATNRLYPGQQVVL